MNSVSDNKDFVGVRDLTGLINITSYGKEFSFSSGNINGIVHFFG